METKKVDTDKLNVASLVARFNGETPTFWKKVRNLAIAVVGVAGGVLVAAPAAPFVIPAVIITACQYIAFGGFVMGIGSQLTVKPKTEAQ